MLSFKTAAHGPHPPDPKTGKLANFHAVLKTGMLSLKTEMLSPKNAAHGPHAPDPKTGKLAKLYVVLKTGMFSPKTGAPGPHHKCLRASFLHPVFSAQMSAKVIRSALVQTEWS